MYDKNFKLVLPAITYKIGDWCNPDCRDAKVSIHYFGGSSVNIVTTGVPQGHAICIDLPELIEATVFFKKIIAEEHSKDKQISVLQKMVMEAREELERLSINKTQ